MILYGQEGIFDTRDCVLVTYREDPNKVWIDWNCERSAVLYTDVRGVELELAGDSDGAKRYMLTGADIQAADWKERYERIDTGQ